MSAREPTTLRMRLDGPLVEDHRLPLAELLRVGKQLRDSLRDVAVVLSDHGPSGGAGRAKRMIEAAVDLRVVGAPQAGSFVLEFETPPDAPPEQAELLTELGPALSERAVHAFIDGLARLDEEREELPAGFDRGVLKAVVPFRIALKKGLTEIALSSSGGDGILNASITAEKIGAVERLIRQPIKAQTSAEGMLQMIDFAKLEGRIDRIQQPSITVYFDEKDRDAVDAGRRQHVRVVGEGEFDPDAYDPSKIWARSIEVPYEALPFDPQAFWTEKGVEELAQEQGVVGFQLPEEVEADPWRDDEDAAAFIEAIRSV